MKRLRFLCVQTTKPLILKFDAWQSPTIMTSENAQNDDQNGTYQNRCRGESRSQTIVAQCIGNAKSNGLSLS